MFSSTIRIRLAVGVIALLAMPAPALGQSLPQLLPLVIDQHPDILRARSALEVAQEVVKQSYSAFLPRLGLQHDEARATNRPLGVTRAQETRQTAVFLQWNLFNGGGDIARLNSTESGRDAARADLDNTREELALVLTELYVAVLTAERQVRNATLLVEDLKVLSDIVRERVNRSASAESELWQATSKLLQAKNVLALAQGRLAGARNRLAAVVGGRVDRVDDPDLAGDVVTKRLDQLVDIATRVNPQVLSARSRARGATADARVAESEWLPKVQFEARKNVTLDGPVALQSGLERESLLSVSYVIPLGGATYFRWTEAQARRAAADATIESVKRRIQAELGETREVLAEQRAIARQIEERVQATIRVHMAYRLQYEAGKRSLLDLIIVREDQYSSQEALIVNLSDQHLGAARVHRNLGQLRSVIVDPEGARRALLPQSQALPPCADSGQGVSVVRPCPGVGAGG